LIHVPEILGCHIERGCARVDEHETPSDDTADRWLSLDDFEDSRRVARRRRSQNPDTDAQIACRCIADILSIRRLHRRLAIRIPLLTRRVGDEAAATGRDASAGDREGARAVRLGAPTPARDVSNDLEQNRHCETSGRPCGSVTEEGALSVRLRPIAKDSSQACPLIIRRAGGS
jgi:hypothetical protein